MFLAQPAFAFWKARSIHWLFFCVRLSNRTVDVIAGFRRLVSGGPGMICRSDLTRLTKLLQRFKSGGAFQVEIGFCPHVSQRVNVNLR
jgi:hypothetical protein